MSITYDISTYNNQTFTTVVNWETFSNGASGSPIPVNLTGYQASMQIRPYAGSPTILFGVGSFPASGITLNTPSTGAISININPSNYVSVGTGTFYYDLLMIDPNGNQFVLIEGTYVLNPGVSQNQAFQNTQTPINAATVVNLTVTNNLTVDGVSTLYNTQILGGTIDATEIGTVSPSLGYFTVLSNSASANLNDVAITGYLEGPANTTGVTAASGDNSNKFATTQFVSNALQNFSPAELNSVIIGNITPSSGTFTNLNASTFIVSTSAFFPANTTGVTAASGDNSNKFATTQFVASSILSTPASGSTPTSGSTVQIPNEVTKYYIRGSGALYSLTVNLPLIPINNQDVTLIFEIAVTSFSLTAPVGYTINNAISNASISLGSRITTTLDNTIWV
ncbi:MAG: hypothetical protein KGH75_01340 [Rhodospirillales bacterium]|nr:hypothetical protein [Rhodospirillales bacterium]